jgi:hypothetical protein
MEAETILIESHSLDHIRLFELCVYICVSFCIFYVKEARVR